ncbi:MAG: potassium-transporting ATPase subunit F [Pirellulales bacterium]
MNVIYLVGGVTAALLLCYLAVALFKPEWFS